MNKKRFLPVIALLVLSLVCACVPVQAQEALPSEAPAQTASETYGLKTEAVVERKVVPYVRDFLLTGEEQLSIVRNGSFYNIDQGIEPDVVLTQIESFYGREDLVDYLHTIK